MEIGKDEKPRKHKNIYIYICKQKGIRFPIVKKKNDRERYNNARGILAA